MSEVRGRRKVREGRVTSDVMDKTVTVEVVRMFKHTTFKRVVRQAQEISGSR